MFRVVTHDCAPTSAPCITPSCRNASIAGQRRCMHCAACHRLYARIHRAKRQLAALQSVRNQDLPPRIAATGTTQEILK